MRATRGPDPETVERLMAEGAIRLSEAAGLVGTCRGRKRHTSTLVRWIVGGKRGVRLEGYRGPDRTWWTSAKALSRFFAALSAADAGGTTPLPETERDRRERAERELERIRSARWAGRG